MPSTEDLQELVGQTIIDKDGDEVGDVVDVFEGEDGWLAVKTGLFGRKTSWLPADGAEEDGEGSLRVGWTKDSLKAMPDVNDELTPEDEQRLRAFYRHEDDEATTAASDSGAPEQPGDVPVTHDEDSELRDIETGTRPDADEMVRPEVIQGIRPKDSDDIDSSKEKLD